MRGLIDNSVNIGGNQTITGTKTYASDLYIAKKTPCLVLQNTDDVFGNIPTTTKSANVIMKDANGKILSTLSSQVINNGDRSLNLSTQNDDDTTSTRIVGKDYYSQNNTIISGETYSTSQRVYFFGSNGLKIMGGYNTVSTNGTTITFTSPFSNPPFVVINRRAAAGTTQSASCSSITTTNFVCAVSASANTADWIALGR